MTHSTSTPSLATQLRNVVVSPRTELGVTRHVFRSGPAYVLRDPITFKTHRFDPPDYQILSLLDRSSTLGDTFASLVEADLLMPEDESRFYEFVVDLHQRNLLSLPLADGAVLYKRYERRRRAENASRAMGIFFLRIPLVNPDRFLSRTVPVFRWLFTTPAMIAWALLATVSLFVAVARADDLAAPMLTMFSGGNLVLLWLVLIGLKVVHEFGHAYACKAFGGHVPEMGAFFVLFTPLAYVDATDAWSFPSTRQRAAVSLAGVYFESMVGALALFVWAFTGPSTLNTIAYQTVLLATITTALFNLNPLLRYDAYYLASDLSGVPNLRARCESAVASVAKRLFFGIQTDDLGQSERASWPLVCFGLAQLGYRVVIMTTIATVVVMKFGSIGIALAATLIGMTVGKAMFTLGRFIAASDQLHGRRLRASATTLLVASFLIVGTLSVPLPWPAHARGISTFAAVETIHAPSDGVIDASEVRPGHRARAGDRLLAVNNPDMQSTRDAMSAEYRAARAQAIQGVLQSPAAAASTQAREHASLALLTQASRDLDRLEVSATRALQITAVHQPRTGAHVRRGQPLLDVGYGDREAVLLVSEQVMERLTLRTGDEIVCRSPTMPGEKFTGIVISITPYGSKRLDSRTLPLADAISLAIDPATGMSAEPQFMIRLALPAAYAPPANSTIIAQLPVRWMTTGSVLHRRFSLFMNKINRGFSER